MTSADQDEKTRRLEEDALRYVYDPPNCFRFMDGETIAIDGESSITAAFPVKSEYCNPAGSMQGGYITAAFDNTFGPISHICLRSKATTLHINTNYHRPIFPGDVLTVCVNVVTRGKTILHMTAEARNRENQLIASADTTYMALRPKEES